MDKNQPAEVSRSTSLGTYFGMFAFAMILCADKGVVLAPFFPAGLFMGVAVVVRHFNPDAKLTPLSGGEIIFAGYAVYVLVFALFLWMRRWRYWGIACLILACLLILNVAGCRAAGTPRIE